MVLRYRAPSTAYDMKGNRYVIVAEAISSGRASIARFSRRLPEQGKVIDFTYSSSAFYPNVAQVLEVGTFDN